MKIRALIGFVLACLCVCGVALAAYCPSCGSSVESSYAFCPSCGASQPSSGGSTSSGTKSVSSSDFEVTSVKWTDLDSVRISWSDPAGNGPYSLMYVCRLTDDFDYDLDNTTGLWPSVDSVTGTSATMDDLVPGQDYWLVVVDQNYDYCTYELDGVPVTHFQEFGTDIGIQLKTRKGNTYTEKSSFSASDIEENIGTVSYGAYIKLTYPQLARERHYNCMVAITDPTGEVIVDTITDMDLSSGRSYTYWTFFSFDWYFNNLLEYLGSIPTGAYTWSLYYDGQFVNAQTFNVTR